MNKKLLAILVFMNFFSMSAMESIINVSQEDNEIGLIEQLKFCKAYDYKKPTISSYRFLSCFPTIRDANSNEITSSSGSFQAEALSYSKLGIKDFKNHINHVYSLLDPQELSDTQIKFKNKLRITRLILNNNQLENLPEELKDLPLEELEADDNNFSKLPPVLAEWKNTLKAFSMNRNRIREFEKIDKSPLSDFKKLAYISLKGNPIKKIPEQELLQFKEISVFLNGEFKLGMSESQASNIFPDYVIVGNRGDSDVDLDFTFEDGRSNQNPMTTINGGRKYQQLNKGDEN